MPIRQLVAHYRPSMIFRSGQLTSASAVNRLPQFWIVYRFCTTRNLLVGAISLLPSARVGLKSHLSKSNRMKVIGDRSQVKSSQTGWFVLVARVKSLNVCRNNKSSQSQRQSDLKVAKKVMLEIAWNGHSHGHHDKWTFPKRVGAS